MITRMHAGQYELGERLGGGSFGAVYRARNKNTGRAAAVKVALTSEGEDGISLLQHEGNMHSTLVGVPGVPQLKACGPWEKGYYLALPLLGQTLSEAVRDKGSPAGISETRETAALAVCLVILRTLQKVHGRGLVHRDVTPDNIMFGQNGRGIWLCDFGLARPYRENRVHQEETRDNALVGTSAFVSAAVRAGVRPSRRDDIESLAYCVWYVICGGGTPWTQCENGSLDQMASLTKSTGHPIVFRLLSHARSLGFRSEPDYEGLMLDARRARASGQYIRSGVQGSSE